MSFSGCRINQIKTKELSGQMSEALGGGLKYPKGKLSLCLTHNVNILRLNGCRRANSLARFVGFSWFPCHSLTLLCSGLSILMRRERTTAKCWGIGGGGGVTGRGEGVGDGVLSPALMHAGRTDVVKSFRWLPLQPEPSIIIWKGSRLDPLRMSVTNEICVWEEELEEELRLSGNMYLWRLLRAFQSQFTIMCTIQSTSTEQHSVYKHSTVQMGELPARDCKTMWTPI